MSTLTARPVSVVQVAPNWFTMVMGTGIVATAAATLPGHLPGLRAIATVVWALAAVLLVAFGIAWGMRRSAVDPVMAQAYGAPPMALMTVGAGALLLGRDVIGLNAALAIDWTLWTAGTLLGLASAVAIPYRMITRQTQAPDAAFGGWLMPVVPPMVSAATGALLIPHTPQGQARLTMTVLCLAMFGLSLIAAFLIIPMVYSRLIHHEMPAAATVPSLWIVLGPLGQSVTAAGLLSDAAPELLPKSFALVFGLTVWGFAMLWLALVVTVTVRTVRSGLPFTLGWWAFTFPLGTCVTATSVLAAHSGVQLFAVVAVGLYALLLTAWAVVATRTVSRR